MPTSQNLSKVGTSKRHPLLRKRLWAVVLTALVVAANVVGVLKPSLAGLTQDIVNAVQAVKDINIP